jgi:murein L,D-transpeptidase YcbB/YkuD
LDKRRLKEYDPKDTTALIQPLEETTRLWLQKPMPLYFDYRTVYFDRKWNAHQCYDIYDENKHILKAMEKLGY